MSGKNGGGAPRSVEQLALRWNHKKVAFLSHLNHLATSCRIDTLDETIESHVSIAIIPSNADRLFERRTGRYALPWKVEETDGGNAVLGKITSSVVYIAGIPAPGTPKFGDETNGPRRPYVDMLFPNGSFELIVPSEEPARPIQTLRLGSVCGLVVDAPDTSYPIWSPSAELSQ